MQSVPDYEILDVEIEPKNATEQISYESKNSKIFKVEKINNTRVKIIPVSHGTSVLIAKSSNVNCTTNINVTE